MVYRFHEGPGTPAHLPVVCIVNFTQDFALVVLIIKAFTEWIPHAQVFALKLGQHGARDQYVTSEVFLQERNIDGCRNPIASLDLDLIWYRWLRGHGTLKRITSHMLRKLG